MPFIVVTTPLPQTCVGPLELEPRNTVIRVPLTVVGIPEPHIALGTGMLLDVVLLGHEQELLIGCVDIAIELMGLLLPSPRKDEIMPGTATVPCAEKVETIELEFAGVVGHDEHIGQVKDELVGGDGMDTTRTVGGGGRARELEFVGG